MALIRTGGASAKYGDFIYGTTSANNEKVNVDLDNKTIVVFMVDASGSIVMAKNSGTGNQAVSTMNGNINSAISFEADGFTLIGNALTVITGGYEYMYKYV